MLYYGFGKLSDYASLLVITLAEEFEQVFFYLLCSKFGKPKHNVYVAVPDVLSH